jgi:hypothetical protein
MKRRDFLKGLTTTSVAVMSSEIAYSKIRTLAANPLAPTTTASAYHLNVFVHGMFAIVVDLRQPPKARLLAPRVSGTHAHRYFSKLFRANGTGDLTGSYSHEVTGSARVAGNVDFQGATSSNFDPTTDPTRIVIMLDQTSDIPGNAAWTIDLPAVPNDICQLRAAHFNYFNLGLTYLHSQLNVGQWCPVVNVLTYEFTAQPTVMFTPDPSATPQAVQFDNGVGRIHLFAEPATQMTCNDGHLQDAINEFNKLFHQVLDLNLMSTTDCLYLNSDPVPSTCQKSGILLCEERSLEELTRPCSDFVARRPQAQQQYEQDKATQQILSAWKAQILTADQKKSLKKDSKRSTLTKASVEFIENNQKLLTNGKPPSNCMSMVCLYPGG